MTCRREDDRHACRDVGRFRHPDIVAFAARDRCSGIDVLVGRRRDRGEQPVVEALVVALET
jgi:hypothetical protein